MVVIRIVARREQEIEITVEVHGLGAVGRILIVDDLELADRHGCGRSLGRRRGRSVLSGRRGDGGRGCVREPAHAFHPTFDRIERNSGRDRTGQQPAPSEPAEVERGKHGMRLRGSSVSLEFFVDHVRHPPVRPRGRSVRTGQSRGRDARGEFIQLIVECTYTQDKQYFLRALGQARDIGVIVSLMPLA